MKPLKPALVVLAVFMVGAAVAVFSTGVTVTFVGAMFGFPLAMVAFGFAVYAARNWRLPSARAAIGLMLLVCIGQTAIAMASLRATRTFAKSSVSAANLRGIHQAMRIYQDNYGEYPASRQAIIAFGASTAKQFYSPGDPAFSQGDSFDELTYSSYVYAPGTGEWREDPELILAWENGDFSAIDIRLLGYPGRMTLFADGHVEALEASEFARKRTLDAQRRRELGWPILKD